MTEAKRSRGTFKTALVMLTALFTLGGAVVAFMNGVFQPAAAEPATTSMATTVTTPVTVINQLGAFAAKEPDPSPTATNAVSPASPTEAAQAPATEAAPTEAPPTEAPSPAEPAPPPAETAKRLCLGFHPELSIQSATVRYLQERHGQRRYLLTLLVRSNGDAPVSVSHVGDATLIDDTGRALSNVRYGFPSGSNVPLRKAESLFGYGVKVGSAEPVPLTYSFVRASHRGQTASLNAGVVLAQKLPDGNFTAVARTVTCDDLKVN